MTMTTTQLLDLDGIGQRASEVRFDVLDLSLQRIGTVYPDLDASASIENNINRTIKRTITGIRLNSIQQSDIDPFRNRLRPVWVLEDSTEHNLGVFVFASMDRARYEGRLDANIEGVDQTIMLDQGLERSVSYSAGTLIWNAIADQLEAAGVVSYDIDVNIVQAIANPISWPAGDTTRVTVINDLAALGGAYSVYFDRDGIAVVRRVPDLASVTPTLVYESGGRILLDSMIESDDLLDAPNRYIVIDSSNVDNPIVGYADVEPSAPYSQYNRGFVVAKVISEQGLVDANAATLRARAAMAEDRSTYSWVQFSSPPDPRHDTYDAVQYLGAVYREQSWRLPLVEGGEMQHDLRRVFQAVVTGQAVVVGGSTVAAGVGYATGIAHDATVSGTDINASPQAGAGLATGLAHDGVVPGDGSALAEAATASGASNAATVDIGAAAGSIVVTGAGSDATTSAPMYPNSWTDFPGVSFTEQDYPFYPSVADQLIEAYSITCTGTGDPAVSASSNGYYGYHLEDCRIRCQDGPRAAGSPKTFLHCYIESISDYGDKGIRCSGGSGITVQNSKILAGHTNGACIYGGDSSTGTIELDGCYFGAVPGHDAPSYLLRIAADGATDVKVRNCVFEPGITISVDATISEWTNNVYSNGGSVPEP